MLRTGIVGLPNVGKSTLFNALTSARNAQSANYPFCTIEPNVGVVNVPDSRLEILKDLVHTNVVSPTTIEFVDIAGLVKGASRGEGLGNKFLSHIREVDAIVHVVRCFDDDNIMTWKNGVTRALKNYIKDGTKVKQACPECGQESLVYKDGCVTCVNCGHSKCG